VGKGASLGRATRASSHMRPTGPASGRPDDKLCPRRPTSPSTAWAKSCEASAISRRLWQATLPALLRLFARKMSRIVRYGFINGLPGFVTIEPDDTLQTTALQIDDGKIVAIYVMRNPDKLQHLGGHGVH
jgi:hypothetical protein